MPSEIYYPPIGHCIYCGERRLPKGVSRFGDEHIFPFAIGGNLVLPQSSCRDCERIINREIETPILSQEWGIRRAKVGLPTRNKIKRSKLTHVMVRNRDGRKFYVSIEEFSAPVLIYKFSEARILSGLPQGMIDDNRWTIEVIADTDKEIEMHKKYPNWDGKHRMKTRPHEFARFLAKIAYCYTVAEWGLNGFTPFVIDLILGRSADYFYLVGGSFDIPPPIPEGGHRFEMELKPASRAKLLIVTHIRFFSSSGTPVYHVVVGEIDIQNPEHIAYLTQHTINGKIEIKSIVIG
jgi:hypothetical protein